MSDLTEKFVSLEHQLTTQHDALMDALSGIGESLAAIAVALTPVPPTGPTLADVIAAIEAGNAIATDGLARLTTLVDAVDVISINVGDIHLDTMSMDLKLLAMRGTLGDIHLDTQSIDQKLLRIRDAINPLTEALPEGGLTSIPWLLYRLLDAIAPEWPRTTAPAMQPGLAAALSLMALYLPEIALIHDSIGVPTGDATTTVLGLLSSLQYSNTLLVTGQQHLIECGCPTTAEGCDAPYISSGLWLAPFGLFGYEGVMVALWPTPPTGITYGSYFGIGEDFAELHNDDWTGWQIFVESSEPQYSVDTGPLRYPTGAWQAIPPGPANYTFSVNQKGALKVTLCAPSVPPPDPGTGTGFATYSAIFEDTSIDDWRYHIAGGWDLDNSDYGGMFPTVQEGAGQTCYVTWCANNTDNADKRIDLYNQDTPGGTLIVSIPQDATVSFTATSDRLAYPYTFGRNGPGDNGFVAITFGWTEADSQGHCPE